MKLKIAAVLALIAVPFVMGGCSPECVDLYDCAAKAKKANADFTCEAGVCKQGSPFPAEDGGTP
jgi:hypothetical protein